MAVVAIARLIGARAHDVADRVAERLAAEVVDRHLIDEVARRLQVDPETVSELDEVPTSRLDRLLAQFAASSFEVTLSAGAERWEPPFAGDPTLRDPKQATARTTDAVIRQLIVRGDCVIMGRGAAFIARAYPQALRVFVCADFELRVAEIAASLKLAEADARRRVKETDANWRDYVRHFYGADLHDASNYDLSVDTGRLGPEAAAELVELAARRLQG